MLGGRLFSFWNDLFLGDIRSSSGGVHSIFVSCDWIRVSNSIFASDFGGVHPDAPQQASWKSLHCWQVFPEQQELMQRTAFLELILKEETQQKHQMRNAPKMPILQVLHLIKFGSDDWFSSISFPSRNISWNPCESNWALQQLGYKSKTVKNLYIYIFTISTSGFCPSTGSWRPPKNFFLNTRLLPLNGPCWEPIPLSSYDKIIDVMVLPSLHMCAFLKVGIWRGEI